MIFIQTQKDISPNVWYPYKHKDISPNVWYSYKHKDISPNVWYSYKHRKIFHIMYDIHTNTERYFT